MIENILRELHLRSYAKNIKLKSIGPKKHIIMFDMEDEYINHDDFRNCMRKFKNWWYNTPNSDKVSYIIYEIPIKKKTKKVKC